MNVRVDHNGSNITSHVIRYDREAKICTGIGMFEMEIDYTYTNSFDPWDVIDLYEEGHHSGKYFVSTASRDQPNSVSIVSCQDNSKRLSDYFITDSYLIDYPSYSKYWIQLFLDEVGINYEFVVSGDGNLLSNNTALGLMSAYEQIMMLLQMNGWYITFNASGKAIIGKANTDLGSNGGNLGSHDVIEIKVDKNDRMYRNRVVVWGNGDPTTNRWVFADVSKPTKWDYDSRDKRTILISNSNIPTIRDAFYLANLALTEFSKLTTEKHITATGGRDISVGDVVHVGTKIFNGKGLVTTFGTSMSKDGLVSNIALDERCPRLFGFFDLGGYVYVGTFGSGVWRKHILTFSGVSSSGTVQSGLAPGFSGAMWLDYSSGLMDMNVTDLHVNNGILASVTSSGLIYYSDEYYGVWSGIPLSGFQVINSGIMIDDTVYSGLMGRACIIDRDTNYLRYAIDTRSGINYGDFLMETDPFGGIAAPSFQYLVSGLIFSDGILGSGAIPSGHSWIMDSNPFDGTTSGVFPVNLSGNYNFSIYDIENDGTHDYVEVMTPASGVMPKFLVNFSHSNPPRGSAGIEVYGQIEYNPDIKVAMSYSGYPTPAMQQNEWIAAGSVSSDQVFAMYDYTPTGNAYVAWAEEALNSVELKVWKIEVNASGVLSETTYSSTISPAASYKPLYIERSDEFTYKYYFYQSGGNIIRREYNTFSGTIREEIICEMPSGSQLDMIIRNGILYQAEVVNNSNGFDIKLHKVVLQNGRSVTRTVLSKEGTGALAGEYKYFASGASRPVKLVPYGEAEIVLFVPYIKRTWINDQGINAYYETQYHRFVLFEYMGDGLDELIYDYYALHGANQIDSFGNYDDFIQTDSSGFPNLDTGALNKECVFFQYYLAGAENRILDFGEYVDQTGVWDSIDKTYNFGSRTDVSLIRSHVGTGGSTTYTFNFVDPRTGQILGTIANPSGYRLMDFAGIDSYSGDLFFRASTSQFSYNLALLELISLRGDGTGAITRRSEAISSDPSEFMLGNFRWTLDASLKCIWYFVKPNDINGVFPLYLVLQRDGWNFNVVKSGIYRDRLELSNYSPLVTMGREISSMETYFIQSDGTVTQTTYAGVSGYNLGEPSESNVSLSGSMFVLGITADDMRYSDFEDTVESGMTRRLFMVYSGSIGSMPIMEEGVFSGVLLSPSGYANRIEISNYSLPDQYMFLSVSGYTQSGNASGWGFFQKDPQSGIMMSGLSVSGIYDSYSGIFVDYSSGYPQARTTIIRLDDRI